MRSSLFLFTALVLSITLSSCEKDEFIPGESVEEAQELTFDAKSTNSLPNTIRQLRDFDTRVPRRIVQFFNNDLDALLAAAEQAQTRRGRRSLRRQGLSNRDIQIILRIADEYQVLLDSSGQDDGGDGTPPADDSPVVNPGVILQISDLNLSADAQLALSFGNPVSSETTTEVIDRTIVSVSTNAANLYSVAGEGLIFNQNGIVITRDELEEQILAGLRPRFNIEARNSVSDFEAVLEEFRPLAANAADNLFALLFN